MPLIVLEGAEGVGKTTQVALLEKHLSGHGRRVVSLREPGGTPLGDEIRRVLLDPASQITPRSEAFLFMASRAQLIVSKVKPALAEGAVVVLDRFFLSTYAYQIAGRGLNESEIVAANQLAVDGVKPDLNVLLSLPIDVGLARAGKRGPSDRMEQADNAFHRRVADAFRSFATREWQKSHGEAGAVVEVDAQGTPDEVHQRVVAAVRATLGSHTAHAKH